MIVTTKRVIIDDNDSNTYNVIVMTTIFVIIVITNVLSLSLSIIMIIYGIHNQLFFLSFFPLFFFLPFLIYGIIVVIINTMHFSLC